MGYELKPVSFLIQSDKIEWSCRCGFHFALEFLAQDSGVSYTLDEFAAGVTGGVGVGCPQCHRRFFLPCVAESPSVCEVTVANE